MESAVLLAAVAAMMTAGFFLMRRLDTMLGQWKNGTDNMSEKLPEWESYAAGGKYTDKEEEKKNLSNRWKQLLNGPDLLKSSLILFGATGIGALFRYMGLSEANIITVYILGVLFISVITSDRIYSIVFSVISVIVFNFLFTEPRFSLSAYEKDYPITFIIMFAAAFLTGSLAAKLKQQAEESDQAAYRTKILFEANRLLERAPDRDKIIAVTAEQLQKLLNRDLVIYPADRNKLETPKVFFKAESQLGQESVSDQEREAAEWVFLNNKQAGAGADLYSRARCMYFPIRVNDRVYGVVGVAADRQPPDAFEKSILLSILGECALALESKKNAKEKEEAAVLAQEEQLRANLLRAISHDLRTPLTSISGNASNLLAGGEGFDEETKRRLYTDIYDDASWLIRLVENLLSVSRIEEGRMNLHISSELMEEIIEEALQHIDRKSKEHEIFVHFQEDFILVKADARLIVQVIINIVDNAVKYTPKGSRIEIETKKEGQWVSVRIADDGPGIPDDVKPYIFDMFYSGANKIADSRRSLGLGLSLCRSIVSAHGGELTVTDNHPRGAVFTFTLPAGEVTLGEGNIDTGG